MERKDITCWRDAEWSESDRCPKVIQRCLPRGRTGGGPSGTFAPSIVVHFPARGSFMSRITFLLAATIAIVPASGAVAQEMPLEQTVDAAIRPGDDFFGYANGAWLQAN